MANFPHSYGELDLQKLGYELKVCTFDFQDGRGPQDCLCLVGVKRDNDPYLRYWNHTEVIDKHKPKEEPGNTRQVLHACFNISIDDASGLNASRRKEAEDKATKEGKTCNYNDFHAAFYIRPRSDVYKSMMAVDKSTIAGYATSSPDTFNALRVKYGLTDERLASWRARNPASCHSTVEQIAETIARRSFDNDHRAGYVYCPSLNNSVSVSAVGTPAVVQVGVSTPGQTATVAPATPAMAAPLQPQYAAPAAPEQPAAQEPDDLPF